MPGFEHVPTVVTNSLQSGECRGPVYPTRLFQKPVLVLAVDLADTPASKQLQSGHALTFKSIELYVVKIPVDAHARVFHQVDPLPVILRAERGFQSQHHARIARGGRDPPQQFDHRTVGGFIIHSWALFLERSHQDDLRSQRFGSRDRLAQAFFRFPGFQD